MYKKINFMYNETNEKNLKKAMDSFLGEKPTLDESNQEMDCSSGVCIIKNDKSVLERINKKIITEDGRQLLT
jgi:hypothetical protein